jgi:hypothetical protein
MVMLSYYYYWQALRRVEESLKTVRALMPDVPPMVEAQHEFNELELAYYREKAEKFTKIALFFIMVSVIILVLVLKGYINV